MYGGRGVERCVVLSQSWWLCGYERKLDQQVSGWSACIPHKLGVEQITYNLHSANDNLPLPTFKREQPLSSAPAIYLRKW